MNNSVLGRRCVLPPSPSSSSSSSSSPALLSPPPATLSPRRTGAPGATELPTRYRWLRPPLTGSGGDHGPQGPQEDPVLGAGPPQPAGPPRRGDGEETQRGMGASRRSLGTPEVSAVTRDPRCDQEGRGERESPEVPGVGGGMGAEWDRRDGTGGSEGTGGRKGTGKAGRGGSEGPGQGWRG